MTFDSFRRSATLSSAISDADAVVGRLEVVEDRAAQACDCRLDRVLLRRRSALILFFSAAESFLFGSLAWISATVSPASCTMTRVGSVVESRGVYCDGGIPPTPAGSGLLAAAAE